MTSSNFVVVIVVVIKRMSGKGKNELGIRGGFRGGDLVTCHPLFSDMTLQSQILVIESLFLTSVSKFIRKYLLSRHFSNMYSSCSNPATSLVKFSENSFKEKLSINESYYRYLISVHCREITLDFYGDAPRHTVCFILVNVL